MATGNTQRADHTPQHPSEDGSLTLLRHELQSFRTNTPFTEDEAAPRLYQAMLNFYLLEGEEDLLRLGNAQSAVNADPSTTAASDDLLDGQRYANNRGLQELLQPLKRLSPAMAAAVKTFEEMLLRALSREQLVDQLRQELSARKAGRNYRIKAVVSSAHGATSPIYVHTKKIEEKDELDKVSPIRSDIVRKPAGEQLANNSE